MTTTIYYFSATGNSLMVAKDLSEQLTDANMVKISKNNLSIVEDTQSDKIGFVFPIYYWGVPVIVKNFIKNLLISKNAYVFAIATYGGMVGTPFSQIKKVLAKKGVKLFASFAVNMPGNCQLMLETASEEEQRKLLKDEKKQIQIIASSIISNQKVEFKTNAIMNSVYNLLYTLTFRPRAVGKNFWTDERCTGCGLCSNVCPASNIVMYDGKPKWNRECESCLACMQWCPQKSIQYKKVTIKRGRYHNPNINVNEIIQKR